MRRTFVQNGLYDTPVAGTALVLGQASIPFPPASWEEQPASRLPSFGLANSLHPRTPPEGGTATGTLQVDELPEGPPIFRVKQGLAREEKEKRI